MTEKSPNSESKLKLGPDYLLLSFTSRSHQSKAIATPDWLGKTKLEAKLMSDKAKAVLGVLFPPYGLYLILLAVIRWNDKYQVAKDRKDVKQAKEALDKVLEG